MCQRVATSPLRNFVKEKDVLWQSDLKLIPLNSPSILLKETNVAQVS